MSRRRTTMLLMLVALAGLVGASFFSTRGGESSPEESATNEALSSAMALGSLEAEAELQRRSEELEEEQEGKRAAGERELRRGEDKVDRIDDLGWRAFNEQFRKTPFDKGIDKLPLRRPPLHVEQWVTDLPPDKLPNEAARERFYRMSDRARAAAVRKFYRSGPKKLYARVDEDRWYRMSEQERAAAVRDFYRDAEKIFKQKGIRDFVLVVTPRTETTEQLPPLAIGRNGSASLTPLGRTRPKPGI